MVFHGWCFTDGVSRMVFHGSGAKNTEKIRVNGLDPKLRTGQVSFIYK